MTSKTHPSTIAKRSRQIGDRLVRRLRGQVSKAVIEPSLALLALATVITCTQLRAQSGDASRPKVVRVGATNETHVADSVAEHGPAGESLPKEGTVVAADRAEAASSKSMLEQWHRALAELAAGNSSHPVRVLWYGDSHTAADYFPNAVRKQLATRFAQGGPGYISLGVPGYRHGLAKVWAEGSIEVGPHPPARRSREDDGVFGLGGTRATLRDTSAYVSVRPTGLGATVALDVELTYRLTSKDDVIRIRMGQRQFDVTAQAGTPFAAGIGQQRFVTNSDSNIELRALKGKPQVFGLVVETQQPGLVIDTLGINGARLGTFLAWDHEVLSTLVMQRRPALFIVAYGTNEVFDPEPVDRHAQRLDVVVQHLRAGAAEASCLVIGPTDIGKGGEMARARAVALDAAERASAARAACAYFSPIELMLSEGGFESWARQDPPLALSDGIHLSVRGYARLGDALYELIR